MAPPWPDLVIGIGRRSVAVARWLKRKNKRTMIVRLGNPRADPRLFDLVITTGQYPVPPGETVLRLPLAMGRHKDLPATEAETNRLAALPRPHLLFSLGGATRYWQFPAERMADTARQLVRRAADQGGTLLIATSPRTPRQTVEAIRQALAAANDWELIDDGRIRFPVLLADADENYVTADSVSMISEAVLAGKPVGLVPVELDPEGDKALGPQPGSSSVRDIRRFWTQLQEQGLIGTVDRPAIGKVEDSLAIAVAAVRRLLGNRVQ